MTNYNTLYKKIVNCKSDKIKDILKRIKDNAKKDIDYFFKDNCNKSVNILYIGSISEIIDYIENKIREKKSSGYNIEKIEQVDFDKYFEENGVVLREDEYTYEKSKEESKITLKIHIVHINKINETDIITIKEGIIKYIFFNHKIDALNTNIIHFPHPKDEPIVNEKIHAKIKEENIEKYIIPWNNKKHRRKCILSNGKYYKYNSEYNINSDYIEEGRIVLWGEWEPPSKAIRIENQKSDAKYVHERIDLLKDKYKKGSENTDPYIFSSSNDSGFWYSCCRQKNFSFLKKLENGDIILFGQVEGDEFLLDTVFVVDESKRCKEYSYFKLENKITPTFEKAVIEKILGTKSEKNYKKECQYTIYKSISYESKNFGYFSFVPCKYALNDILNNKNKITEENGPKEDYYERAKLNLSNFYLSNSTQAPGMNTNKGDSNITACSIGQHILREYYKNEKNKKIIDSVLDNIGKSGAFKNILDQIFKGHKFEDNKLDKKDRAIINEVYWNLIVRQLFDDGFSLGVYVKETE